MSWKPYHSLDLLALDVLPVNWQDQIRDVVGKHSVKTVLTGDGSTSRERKPGLRLTVDVVGGSTIRQELPWLWNLYVGHLRDFASKAFGRPLFPANLEHTAVNINRLSGRGARYEWHVDSNPVTGLLFSTTSAKGDGGSLVFKGSDRRFSLVRPKAGTFICFDARDIPHRVAPLRGDSERLSLPMNYYESPVDQPRPEDLDGQIYTPEG